MIDIACWIHFIQRSGSPYFRFDTKVADEYLADFQLLHMYFLVTCFQTRLIEPTLKRLKNFKPLKAIHFKINYINRWCARTNNETKLVFHGSFCLSLCAIRELTTNWRLTLPWKTSLATMTKKFNSVKSQRREKSVTRQDLREGGKGRRRRRRVPAEKEEEILLCFLYRITCLVRCCCKLTSCPSISLI